MKLPQVKNFKWNYLALAFFVPLMGVTLIMAVSGCAPFGTNSLLSSDAWHQYFPFFKAFRKALLSGESLLYSWTGMGMDYLGLIAYYLASPLNLLSVILPENWLLGYFDLLVPIKLGLAGLFFALFIKGVFDMDDLSLPLFGGFYALCAWAMGYQWNIMWLDTFALLPLVALGTVQLLRDKKFVLYTVSLFLAIVANYYIGFFVCIFVLLVFICYQICRCTSVKKLFFDFCRIGIFTVLAIGMTAFLELPALIAIRTTQSSVNKFPEGFAVNIVTGEAVTKAKTAWKAYLSAKEGGGDGLVKLWFEAMAVSFEPILQGMKKIAGNMNGGIEPTFKEGLPNVYSGVGTILFSFLFISSKNVKLRDKICGVVLIVFFMLSFILRQLDYIWHGFHFTNMIPYRFSFLFSFVMLYMAYRAFLLRHNFTLWQIVPSVVLSILIMLCYEDTTDAVFLTFNITFLVLYTAVIVYTWLQERPLNKDLKESDRKEIVASRDFHRSAAGYILAGVLALELILSAVNAYVAFPRASVASYPRGDKSLNTIVQYMQDNDDSLFYRAEVTHAQTLNDGSLIGYDGVSTFTSSANVKVTEFMQRLGYAAKNTYNRYCFEEASPVSNLFLNLKYMIERDGKVEENNYFDTICRSGNVYLLENNTYLPLGFLAESTLKELTFSQTFSAFDFQNQLFTAATGLTLDVWNMIPSASLTIDPNGTNITSQSESGYCGYKNGSTKTTLYYSYDITQSGLMCLDITMSARNSFTVWKNGTQVTDAETGETTTQMTQLYSESIVLPQTLAVCQVQPGDKIEIRIACKANESGNITIRAATLNETIFRNGYDILAASTLKLTSFSNTKVEGTINCNRDGLLYTSIPQNGENWSVTVDGQPANIVLVGDAMMAVELTEGSHSVCFTYRNDAFSLGLGVSIGSLVIFASIVFVVCILPKLQRKGKYLATEE